MTLEPDLLALLPGCEAGEAPIEVERLAGGSVNRTLRVRTTAGEFVVRAGGGSGARLGVDRRREAALQSVAARAGIAPSIVAASPDARILIAEYVPGRVWTADDLADPAALERLGARLVELQRVVLPAELQTPGFEPLRQIERLAAVVSAAQPAETARVAARVADATHSLAAGGGPRRATLVHLDLHPANLVEGEELMLLDWEYAACGDPALDLASLLAFDPRLDLDADRLRWASGLGSRLAAAELAALRRVFEIAHWLWYRARRAQGESAAWERAAEEALQARLEGSG